MTLNYTSYEDDVNKTLTDLFGGSLTMNMLNDALGSAYNLSAKATKFHAPTAKATYIYHEMVGQLGMIATTEGWTYKVIRNFPIYANQSENCLLLLRTGGKACGKNMYGKPNQILPRGFGAASAKFVTGENTIIDFDDTPNVYMLLFKFDAPSNTMYWEISEPDQMINGKVVSWKSRYFLPPINCTNFDIKSKDENNSIIDFDIEAL